MSQFCISCGAENLDEAKFCKSCGEKLNIEEYQKFDEKEQQEYNEKRIKLSFYEFFFSSNGRISNKEFFLRGFLPLTSLLILNSAFFKYINFRLLDCAMDISEAQSLNYLGMGIYFLIMYSITMVTIKRIHDYNSSGWNAILSFIPVVNIIFLFFLFFKQTVNDNNQYGYETQAYNYNGFRIFLIILGMIFFFMSWGTFGMMLQFERMAISENKNCRDYKPFRKEQSSYTYENHNDYSYEKPKPNFYSLIIETNPSDAKVYIMNIKPEYYDGIKLKEGYYKIKAKRDGYNTLTDVVYVNKNTNYRMTLEKNHYDSNILQIENSLWTNFDKVVSLNWYEAKDYCNSLELGGFTNWELPTISQLESAGSFSLNEYGTKIFQISDKFKNNGYPEEYWARESVNTKSASGTSRLYHPGIYPKVSNLKVLCVKL